MLKICVAFSDFKVDVLRYYIDELASFRDGKGGLPLSPQEDGRSNEGQLHCGWPGKANDARVLRNSKIFEDGQAGRLFQLEGSSRITPERIGTCDVNICLIGEPAYPLLPCITKAYLVHVVTTPTQRRFNYRLSRARMSIENAFGRLKGRGMEGE